jgi:hypothetical protein
VRHLLPWVQWQERERRWGPGVADSFWQRRLGDRRGLRSVAMRTLLWTVAGLWLFGMWYVGLTDDTPGPNDSVSRNLPYVCFMIGLICFYRAMVSCGRGRQRDEDDRKIAEQRRIDAAVEKALAEERGKR